MTLNQHEINILGATFEQVVLHKLDTAALERFAEAIRVELIERDLIRGLETRNRQGSVYGSDNDCEL